ncbi:hypothetical protein Pcinc_031265 [Petrolisthes cinctipes]|uniref:Uncharacterized protein n=1 Tax=Petrolisthes cinctipes TaxID=88211 RepID=A0AAE1K2W1_PETCI|nr:hypothetical protein Pcinc_031265 [Petrolisthes cinctipes]
MGSDTEEGQVTVRVRLGENDIVWVRLGRGVCEWEERDTVKVGFQEGTVKVGFEEGTVKVGFEEGSVGVGVGGEMREEEGLEEDEPVVGWVRKGEEVEGG